MSLLQSLQTAKSKYYGANQSIPTKEEQKRMVQIKNTQNSKANEETSFLARLQKVKGKYFAPSPDEVRIRDFLRENVNTLSSFAKETGKAILQAPQRAATSIVMQPVADIARLQGKEMNQVYTPKSKLEKLFLGEDSITPIGDLVIKNVKENQERIVSKYFGDSPVAEGANIVLTPLFIGGLAGVDLLPVGNAGRKTVKQASSAIAKASKTDDVVKILKNVFQDGDETLKPLAKKLSKVNDEQEIYKTLRTIQKAAEDAKISKASKTARLGDEVVKTDNQLAKEANSFVKKNKVPFELPEQTKVEYITQQVQDKMQRLAKTQDEIIKSGKKITDDLDAYLKQELFPGRAAERIDNFRRTIIKSAKQQTDSLIERMAKSGLKLDEFGDYLKARHAVERNAKIAEINPKFPDGGSGLTNAQAEKIISDFKDSGKLEMLDGYANEFYEKVTKARLDLLEKSGLEKPENIERLRQVYQNYVPLKTDESTLGKVSSGFSASGKNIYRATGSSKMRNNPMVQAIADYENTIVKAEKNEVAKTLLKLAEDNPNPKVWEVESLTYTPKFDEVGELVTMDKNFKYADNVIEARVNGDVKLIKIHDEELAKAIKNLGTERGIKFLSSINSYLRAVNTFFNPEFIITNFERDLQTAMVNLAGEQGGKVAKDVLKDIPKAMKGIWKNVQGNQTDEWAKVYQEMKETGGKVGWFDHKTIEQKTLELNKLVSKYNSQGTIKNMGRFIDGVGDYITKANEVTESAVRLSAYKNAIKAGATKEKAAQIAKNLTVNFNKKGNLGVTMNSLYLFANAGVQGTARTIQALKHPRVRKIVAATALTSYGINEMNRAINEEEYDKIPDFQKDTNLIFMMPNGNHVKVKLPYGYNIFKVFGDVIYDQVHGKKTTLENAKRIMLAADTAFNPLGSADFVQMISPTATDPIIQQYTNKNWFGSPIKPEQNTFGKKVRESSLYFGSVRSASKGVTEWLNKVTGGSEVEAGTVDISPELVDHYIDFLGGGVSRFLANVYDTGLNVAKGDLPDMENMPFIRQMVGTPYENYDQSVIYKMREKSGTKELTEKDYQAVADAIKNGVLSGKVSEDDAVDIIKDIEKNQAAIVAGRIFAEVKSGKKEKEEIVKMIEQLNPMEKEQFIKLIKKDLE